MISSNGTDLVSRLFVLILNKIQDALLGNKSHFLFIACLSKMDLALAFDTSGVDERKFKDMKKIAVGILDQFKIGNHKSLNLQCLHVSVYLLLSSVLNLTKRM